MAVKVTGLKYTSEGIDQFVSNLKKAQLNLVAWTEAGTASSRTIRQAAADVKTHAAALNSMVASSKAITNANKTVTTSANASSKAIAQSGHAAQTASGMFGKLTSGLTSAAKSMVGINSGAAKALGSMTGLSMASSSLVGSIDYLIRRVVLLTATYAAVGAVREWIKTGFEQVVMYDSIRSSLEALIARELVQTGQVSTMAEGFKAAVPLTQELTEWVERLGILSIFESGDIKNVVQLAMAVGITTENAKALTLSLVDWGSVFQATPALLDQVTHALTDMFTKGKVQSEELTRQLANHGIPAWQYLSEALGVTTAEAQKMVFDGLVPANVGIKAITDGINKDFGGASSRMSTTLMGLTSSLGDLKKIGLREFFTGTFTAIMPHLERFVAVLQDPSVRDAIRGWGDSLGQVVAKVFSFTEAMFASGDPFGFLAAAIDGVLPGFYKLYNEFGNLASTVSDIARKAFGWGENIGIELANGVMQAATYIVQALNYIGGIISSWLAPGSPPKLLPDLPEWGESAMSEFIGGMTKFDADMFKDLQSSIRDALENFSFGGGMAEEGIIPALMGGRDSLARATIEIRELGDVTADTMSSIQSWVDSTDPSLIGLIDTYFEFEKASIAVTKAQEELDAINKDFEDRLNAINDAYNESLGPLQARADAMDKEEQALKDAIRMQKNKETIEDDDATDEEKRLAALDNEQIKTRQQIDAIKERQEAEVSATEAAQEAAVTAAEQRLTEAETQQQLAQDAFEAKQSQISLQHEHNALIAEQTKLLEAQAKAAEAAAKAAAGGGGGAGGGGPKPKGTPVGLGPLDLDKGPLADLEKAFDALDQKVVAVKQHWAELKIDFDNAKATLNGVLGTFPSSLEATRASMEGFGGATERTAGIVNSTLEPLKPLAAGIGIAFSSIAAGGVAAFIAKIVSGVSPIGLLVTAGMILFQAWTSNFLGIQEIVGTVIDNITGKSDGLSTFWTSTFQPAIQAVTDFFNTEVKPVLFEIAEAAIPAVMAAGNLLSSIFTNVVVPAGKLLWTVISTLLWPIFEGLASVLINVTLPALTSTANFVADTVLPVFNSVFTFLSDTLIPILTTLAGIIGEALRIAWELWMAYLNDIVMPLFNKLMNDYINPLIDKLFGDNGLGPAIDKVKEGFGYAVGVVDDFVSSLGGLKGVIDSVLGWLKDLKATLDSIHIPSDLEQDSPSPLEITLMDSGRAVFDLNENLMTLQNTFDNFAPPPPDGLEWFDFMGDSILNITTNELPALMGALQSLYVIMTEGMEDASDEMQKQIEEALDAMQSAAEKLPDLIFDATQGMFGSTSSVARTKEKNLDKTAEFEGQQRSRIEAQLAEAENIASGIEDPEDAAAFFRMRSEQIFELAEIERQLQDAGGERFVELMKEHEDAIAEFAARQEQLLNDLNKVNVDEQEDIAELNAELSESEAESAKKLADLQSELRAATSEADKKAIREKIAEEQAAADQRKREILVQIEEVKVLANEQRARLQEQIVLNNNIRAAEQIRHDQAIAQNQVEAAAERERLTQRLELIKQAQEAERLAFQSRMEHDKTALEELKEGVENLFSNIDIGITTPEIFDAIKAFRDRLAEWLGSAGLAGPIVLPPPPDMPGNASGNPNFAGGLTWVGETGKELVWLPRGTSIFSNPDSMNLVKMLSQRISSPSSVQQIMSTNNTSSYTDARQFNLKTMSNNSPQQVYQSFEIMRSMYGG